MAQSWDDWYVNEIRSTEALILGSHARPRRRSVENYDRRDEDEISHRYSLVVENWMVIVLDAVWCENDAFLLHRQLNHRLCHWIKNEEEIDSMNWMFVLPRFCWIAEIIHLLTVGDIQSSEHVSSYRHRCWSDSTYFRGLSPPEWHDFDHKLFPYFAGDSNESGLSLTWQWTNGIIDRSISLRTIAYRFIIIIRFNGHKYCISLLLFFLVLVFIRNWKRRREKDDEPFGSTETLFHRLPSNWSG